MDMCFSLLILKEAWLFWSKAFHILVWESGSRMWLFWSNYHTGPKPQLSWNRLPLKQKQSLPKNHSCHSCSVKPTTSLNLCCLAGAYTFVSNSWVAIPWLKHVQTCPNIAYSNANHIFWYFLIMSAIQNWHILGWWAFLFLPRSIHTLPIDKNRLPSIHGRGHKTNSSWSRRWRRRWCTNYAWHSVADTPGRWPPTWWKCSLLPFSQKSLKYGWWEYDCKRLWPCWCGIFVGLPSGELT